MSKYSCSFRGQCESDHKGRLTREQCERECTALPDRQMVDVALEVLTYDYELALQAAPSDRVQVVRRLTGLVVDSEQSWDTLMALKYSNYLYLLSLAGGREYLAGQLDEFTLFLLEAAKAIRLYRPRTNWLSLSDTIYRSYQEFFQGGELYHEMFEAARDESTIEEFYANYLGEILLLQLGSGEENTQFRQRKMEKYLEEHWGYITTTFGSIPQPPEA
jgi:hypothetical protein